jgi:hypothetical protein
MIDVDNYSYIENFLSIEEKKILRRVNKLLKNLFSIEKIKIDIINKKYNKHKDYCRNIFCKNNNHIEISKIFPELTISKYPYILNKLNIKSSADVNRYINIYCKKCVNEYILENNYL